MERLYRIEPHLHTAESSKCGFISGADFVEQYHALGYDGVVITDHLSESFVSSLNCKHNWDACIDLFLGGYNRARRQGEKIGLHVMLGAEIRFNEPNDSDYLLYGIDEAWLRRNPYPYRLSPAAFFERFGDEILIIQAHPFRGKNEDVFVDCIHGIELYNSSPRHNNNLEKALELSKSHPEFYLFAGSDAHREGDASGAWMLFPELVTSSRELREAVLRKDYILRCRGV